MPRTIKRMSIGIIGSGYVGTVTGAGLADLGNDVIFVDLDQDRVEALNRGKSPLFEPGRSSRRS